MPTEPVGPEEAGAPEEAAQAVQVVEMKQQAEPGVVQVQEPVAEPQVVMALQQPEGVALIAELFVLEEMMLTAQVAEVVLAGPVVRSVQPVVTVAQARREG